MTMPPNDERRASGRGRRDKLISGRKFDANELELMLLWFLGDAPAHGYELIKRFDRFSKGYYSPSPGVLYPALARLESRGYLYAHPSGRRKNYQLTNAGRAYADDNATRTRRLLAILQHAAKKMAWIQHADDDLSAATHETGWLPEFVQTRTRLQQTLLDHSDAGHNEQRRIIAILQRAIDDIRNVTSDAAAASDHTDPASRTDYDHDYRIP